MITPSTKLVNLLEKAQGWKVHSCSHEQMIKLVKTAFLEGASSEQIEQLKNLQKVLFRTRTPNVSKSGIRTGDTKGSSILYRTQDLSL